MKLADDAAEFTCEHEAVPHRRPACRPAGPPASTRAASSSCRWPRPNACSRKTGNVDTLSIVLADGADEKAVAGGDHRAAAHRAERPLADGPLATGQGEHREGRAGAATSPTSTMIAAGVLHDPQHLPDERRRAAAAVGRAAGDRRHPPANHPHVAAGRAGDGLRGHGPGLRGRAGRRLSADAVDGPGVLPPPCPPCASRPRPSCWPPSWARSVSLLAMFVPAWIAGRVSPLEGMRFVAAEGRAASPPATSSWPSPSSSSPARRDGGLHVRLSADPLDDRLGRDSSPRPSCCWCRWCWAGWRGWRRWLLRPLLRTEGRIAHRQVLRRRVRTTLTIGILYFAVSTAISLGTTILNNVDDIHDWVATALKGDFFVRAVKQDMANRPGRQNARRAWSTNSAPSTACPTSIRVRYISGSILTPAVGGRQAAGHRLRPRLHRQGQPAADDQVRRPGARSASNWPRAKS